jgi:uncharacterized membrane protein YhiD involved in acid resistance
MPLLLGLVEVAVVATIVTLLVVLVARRLEARGKGDVEQGMLAEQADELRRLRARVETLETLATDEDRRLASDIERLRGGAPKTSEGPPKGPGDGPQDGPGRGKD